MGGRGNFAFPKLYLHPPFEASLTNFPQRGPSEKHPEYWIFLYRLISRGMTKEAAELLRQHSLFPTQDRLHANEGTLIFFESTFMSSSCSILS